MAEYGRRNQISHGYGVRTLVIFVVAFWEPHSGLPHVLVTRSGFCALFFLPSFLRPIDKEDKQR